MILLVEGVDRAGKTTLIQELVKLLGWPVEKHSKIPDSEIMKRIINVIDREKTLRRNVIFDRFYWPSDVCYNPVVEGKPSLVASAKKTIQRNLALLQTVVVLVTASDEEIKRRYQELGDDPYLGFDGVSQVKKNYKEEIRGCVLPTLTIETSKDTKPAVLAKIVYQWLRSWV